MGLVWGVVLWGLLYFVCFFLPFFSFSSSLFCFLLEKRMWWYLVTGGAMLGVICMDGKHKTRKMIQKPLLGLLALWEEKKKVIEKLFYNDFISLGLEAWVILMEKPQHFWDVLAHAILGVVLGKFLSFDFLSVVVISLIAYMTVSGSPARVCSVWILFSLCVSAIQRNSWVVPFPFPLSFPFAVVSICLFWESKAQSTLPRFQLLC